MPEVIDQLGRQVRVPAKPQRIVSLVPSQTELLAALGLEKEVVGITKFCVHPTAWFHQKTRIGGTKQLNLKTIDALQPDLIIGNKEENDRDQINALAERYPVWLSDVRDWNSALTMMALVGAITHRPAAAQNWVDRIAAAYQAMQQTVAACPAQRVAYLIWRTPYMVAADDTFIHATLTSMGLTNVFGNRSRYPVVSATDLADATPEVILLSSEPYPFKAKHLAEIQAICPDATIKLVDGEAFSWYGSRLLEATEYLCKLRLELTAQ